MIADQEEIARLDVQMLQAVLAIHQVQDFGRLDEVAEQILAGDAGKPLVLIAIVSTSARLLIGQLRDDHELAADAFDAIHRQQKRMAKVFDVLDGLEFFVRLGGVAPRRR